jgi:hypothetical protein
MECLICLQPESESESESESVMTETTCCRKSIHQKCLERWFAQYNSHGRCPHCRFRLRPVTGLPPSLLDEDETSMDLDDLDLDLDLEFSWSHPRGYIRITSGHGSCDIRVQPTEPHIQVPIVYKCCYTDMEQDVPNAYITNGYVIVLTDEQGDYSDALNIPSGWMLCVNNESRSLQLSNFLRLE